MSGIYIASKTRHAPKWQALRAAGLPIISTWIDEAGVGESADLADLWSRCVREASSCKALIFYAEGDDVLKGGFIEVGAALASNIPVYVVLHDSAYEGQSFMHHPLVYRAKDMESALAHARDHVFAHGQRQT